MNIKYLDLKELENGYQETEHGFSCIHCDYKTSKSEVYAYENRFFTSEAMMRLHILQEHGGNLKALLDIPKKTSAITDNQKKLMFLLSKRCTDKEIANELGIKEATVRYQRFMLKEKETQCRIFLAAMANLGVDAGADFLDIHTSAAQVDERYIATEKDREKAVNDFFLSLSPLKLKSFPAKEKYKIIVLRIISDAFNEQQTYSEKDMNDILKGIYEDFVTLRRYLIEYGFFTRDAYGHTYRKNISS